MDIRNILGKLDQLSEGTMASAKKKPTGPKFTGKMKGTDPASAAKSKYVGGESILRDLEAKLNEEPEKRDLMKEFREFKEARAATAAFRAGNNKRAALNAMSPEERAEYDRKRAEQQRKRDDARLERERQKNGVKEGFSDLELAVMEGGHELIKENPAAPTAPAAGKPTLGTDLTKPEGQQDAEQQQQDQKAQQLAAQKEKQEQATLQKGVNDLKSAGAAVSNPAQVVKAFDKAEDNQGLTPADKNSIASAGTVLAPIMANPALQGKFKDLVTQASAEQKKQQQQQAKQAQATGGAQGTAVNSKPATPAPAGQVK